MGDPQLEQDGNPIVKIYYDNPKLWFDEKGLVATSKYVTTDAVKQMLAKMQYDKEKGIGLTFESVQEVIPIVFTKSKAAMGVKKNFGLSKPINFEISLELEDVSDDEFAAQEEPDVKDAPGGHTDTDGSTDLKGFDCDNGMEISKFQLCNLVKDCSDGSDEDEKKCRKLCSSDQSGDECINELCYLNSTRVEEGGGVTICTNLSIEVEDKCKRIHQSKVSGAFYCHTGECVPLNVTCYSRSDCMVNGGRASCQKISETVQTTTETVIETDGGEVKGNGTWGWVTKEVLWTLLVGVLVLGVLSLGGRKLWKCIYRSPSKSYTRVKATLNITDPVNKTYKWVLTYGGAARDDAVSSGTDRGTELHVIRASYKGELVPGKIHNGRVLIPYKGFEVVIRGWFRLGYYEVLTDPDNVLEWIPCSSEDGIPQNAVVGGGFPKTHESDLGIYYIGRFEHNRTVTCGKVNADNRRCYISYAWQKHWSDTYEILVDSSMEEPIMPHLHPLAESPKPEPTATASTSLLEN